jgi:HPt (histidine-containing phosphotransfer) domain-containing protein
MKRRINPNQAKAVFDYQGLLIRLMNDRELVRVVGESFLEELPSQIEMLKEFVTMGNVEESRRLAHSVKGAASNVGGNALSEVAHAIERAVSRGELAIAREMLTEACAAFDQLSLAMRTIFDTQP